MQNQIADLQPCQGRIAGDDMRTLPMLDVSKGAAKRAGRVLRSRIPADGDAVSQEAIEAFATAHAWRAGHLYPMRIEQRRLIGMGGALTAARLKRMASIRSKLENSNVRFEQMQDLGACRAILPDKAALDDYVAKYRGKYAARIKWAKDYVSEPKASGYRSVHVIVQPDSEGEREVHNLLKIEVQFRTRLQHVWATAQEAIGYMRGEALKSGQGDPRWLSFMALMGAEIALLDGGVVGEHMPESAAARRREIAELDAQLGVVQALSSYRMVEDVAEDKSGAQSVFLLIQMDAEAGHITVMPYRGAVSYDNQGDTSEGRQTLLVSVQGVRNLKETYPNFFLDVSEFVELVKDVNGRGAPDLVKGMSGLDLSFLKGIGGNRD